jgi:NTE family protein
MSQTVSLVLGSGGARGLAHIGVIHELEKQDFEIRAITGCSVGSLIGGFYCTGKLDIFEEWVCSLSEWDVVRFLDISLTARNGVVKGDLIMNTLRDLIGDQCIEDLPIPFRAIATSIVDRKEVWLGKGSLFDAMRASMAIPGIFTPKKINGKILVDGGLLDPLPSAAATSDGTDLTVAVSLSGRDMIEPYGPNPPKQPLSKIARYRKSIDGFLDRVQDTLGMEAEPRRDKERELGLTDIMLGSFDTMQAAIARYRLAAFPPDLLIEVPGNICQTHEIYKARALIDAGRYWAADAIERQSHVLERNKPQ